MAERAKIVLYHPQSARRSEPPHSRYADELPLSLLTVAAWPLADGYRVELVDGTRFPREEAHRRAVQACEGALLYATTGIVGPQVGDGLECTRAVKARHPALPAFIGGWFAASVPELQLATGLYEAVVLGQGEITFRELVTAVDSGARLEEVAGLALLREGQLVRTAPRPVVGWEDLLDPPWRLLDVEDYRGPQLRRNSALIAARRYGQYVPRFQVPYYSSFGCPVQCSFCCSPEFSGRRWKAMPAERILEDLAGLQERWGFDAVEFWDANFAVDLERTEDFARGLLGRGMELRWFAYVQAESILRASPELLDLWAASGMYGCLVGAEAALPETLRWVRKGTRAGGNLLAARELDPRGIHPRMTYIVGYPGEAVESMQATLEEALRIALECATARPEVWHFRPLPGSEDFQRAIDDGYRPPTTLEEWARVGDYFNDEPWPGRIPPAVERRRRLFLHYSSLAQGTVRQKMGWWERRARRHLECGTFGSRRLEASAFHVYDRLTRRPLLPRNS